MTPHISPEWRVTEIDREIMVGPTTGRISMARVTLAVPIIQVGIHGAIPVTHKVTGAAVIFRHDAPGLEDAFERADHQARALATRIRRANPDHYATPPRY